MAEQMTPTNDSPVSGFNVDLWGRYGWFTRTRARLEISPQGIQVRMRDNASREWKPIVHADGVVHVVALAFAFRWMRNHLLLHDGRRFVLVYMRPWTRRRIRTKVRSAGFQVERHTANLWTAMIGPALRRSLARRGVLPKSFSRARHHRRSTYSPAGG